jgi:hypothetical protein
MVSIHSLLAHKIFGQSGLFHNMKGGTSLPIKNNTFFVSVFLVLFLFTLLMVLNPAIFLYLFNTLFGNILLVLFILFIGMFDIKWALGLALFFFILYYFLNYLKTIQKKSETVVETMIDYKSLMQTPGSDNQLESKYTGGDYMGGKKSRPVIHYKKWSDQTIQDFINFENVTNPLYIFDLDIIQQQATEDDVKYLLQNGKWYWSPEIQQLYMDSVALSQFISVDPGISLNIDQTIYNQNAIKQILSWNTKEGTFLLSGITIGHSKNMPKDRNNTIKCTIDKNGGPALMKKKVYKGYNSYNAAVNYELSEVINQDLPNQITGFQFVKGPCNPCVALNDPNDYSCPFTLDTGNGTEITPIWKMLWGV